MGVCQFRAFFKRNLAKYPTDGDQTRFDDKSTGVKLRGGVDLELNDTEKLDGHSSIHFHRGSSKPYD